MDDMAEIRHILQMQAGIICRMVWIGAGAITLS